MAKKRKIANLILLALEKSIDGYIRFVDFAYNPRLYAYGNRWEQSISKSSLSRALKRLKERGLVELASDRELAYRLTDSGRNRAIWAQLNVKDERWDGKWRLILFDVPEKRRSARDLLRERLKQWGFIQFQQSVWGTKKNCKKHLKSFIKSVGIEDWVMVVESDDIGR